MIDLRLLSDRSQHRKYAAGQRIVGAEDSLEMYIIVSGKVEVFAITLMNKLAAGGTIGPGESIGEIAFFTGLNRLVFKAAEETTVFVVSDKNFEMLCKTQPRLFFALLQRAYGGTGSEDVRAMMETAKKAKATEAKKEQEQIPDAETKEPESTQTHLPALFPSGHKSYPGITQPEYKKFIYNMDYTCPNCGAKFTSFRVFASKLVPSAKLRFDLRAYYQNFEMSWYEIITCPECYFSSFEEYFTSSKALNRSKIKDALTVAKGQLNLDFDAERNLDFVFTGYYLALICAVGYSSFRQMNMKIWANLSWLYEDMGDEEMMKMAALNSADASEAVYMETNLSKPQEQVICLSTAGMLYRAGAHKGLMKWLFNAKVIKTGKNTYVDLAEDLMEKVRAEKQPEPPPQ